MVQVVSSAVLAVVFAAWAVVDRSAVPALISTLAVVSLVVGAIGIRRARKTAHGKERDDQR